MCSRTILHPIVLSGRNKHNWKDFIIFRKSLIFDFHKRCISDIGKNDHLENLSSEYTAEIKEDLGHKTVAEISENDSDTFGTLNSNLEVNEPMKFKNPYWKVINNNKPFYNRFSSQPMEYVSKIHRPHLDTSNTFETSNDNPQFNDRTSKYYQKTSFNSSFKKMHNKDYSNNAERNSLYNCEENRFRSQPRHYNSKFAHSKKQRPYSAESDFKAFVPSEDNPQLNDRESNYSQRYYQKKSFNSSFRNLHNKDYSNSNVERNPLYNDDEKRFRNRSRHYNSKYTHSGDHRSYSAKSTFNAFEPLDNQTKDCSSNNFQRSGEKNFRPSLQKIHNKNYSNLYNDKPERNIVNSEEEGEIEDCDKFGDLADDDLKYKLVSEAELLPDDDDDLDRVEVKTGRRPYFRYHEDIEEFLRQKKLKEALLVLDHMREVGVSPPKSIYTSLIGACGRAGYLKMAFMLFKKMRDRHFIPTSATLTGLFNACAECPFPDYGLKKATNLRQRIEETGWRPDNCTYHAMIKAFGRCGDIETAFELVDEMIERKFSVTADTFSFLLMACISNKDCGFTFAIQVMRKLQKFKISPIICNFNLLLRCVRDCDIGPPEISSCLLTGWKRDDSKRLIDQLRNKGLSKRSNEPEMLSLPAIELKLLEENKDNKNTLEKEVKPELSQLEVCEPLVNESEPSSLKIQLLKEVIKPNSAVTPKPIILNLLATRSSDGPQIVELSNIVCREDRLALLGGAQGFLAMMKATKTEPDIKTFSLLVDCAPPTVEAENAIIEYAEEFKVKLDTDFFNQLIKRRSFRSDYEAAKDCLSIMLKIGLYPDIVTYGVLALTCKTRKLGREFLKDMEDSGCKPNAEIIGTLCTSAKIICDFWYMIDLMNKLSDLNINPNPKMLEDLESAYQEGRRIIISMEKGQVVQLYFQSDYFKDGFKTFQLCYEQWLKKTEVEKQEHPWDQYKIDYKQIY